jgi:hypothetical protein
MRKKYRNELFALITDSQLPINDFSLKDEIIEDLPAVVIQYKNTPFKFVIRNAKNSYEDFDYQYVPYSPEFIMGGMSEGFVDFDEVHSELDEWIESNIKAYLEDEEESDLWQEFNRGNSTVNLNEINFEEKSNFSKNEKAQLVMAMNELKFLIHKNFDTTNKEQDLVNQRIEYLIDSIDTLNKFDWKGSAISTIISIAISLTLDTEKGKLLFELFKRVLSIIPKISN